MTGDHTPPCHLQDHNGGTPVSVAARLGYAAVAAALLGAGADPTIPDANGGVSFVAVAAIGVVVSGGLSMTFR